MVWKFILSKAITNQIHTIGFSLSPALINVCINPLVLTEVAVLAMYRLVVLLIAKDISTHRVVQETG